MADHDERVWRYYPWLRTWARGERRLVLPQCPMGVDRQKVMERAGVFYLLHVQCQLVEGHEGNHRSAFPLFAEWRVVRKLTAAEIALADGSCRGPCPPVVERLSNGRDVLTLARLPTPPRTHHTGRRVRALDSR